jgi:DNA repair protein RAD50
MGKNNESVKHTGALKNIQTLQNKIEQHSGQMSVHTEQKKSLKKKLGEPKYKDVNEKHHMKMIEHETTNIVVTDLEKYYDALEKALYSYHGTKISDINKIIRELWPLTYKGKDISNIEIQRDQDSASCANLLYCIFIYKGATQMDRMRGRCIASQRVLESIVICLALAETFFLNCGVLALDKPTTNLDYKNKRGLAIAMAQIIVARASQSNFQLVVITHDKDFVSMMKQELAAQTGFSMASVYFAVLCFAL